MSLVQQAYDAAIKQGEQSIWNGACKYRSGDLKCAVGHLIKDEHYRPKLEGKDGDSPSVRAALELSIGRELTDDERQHLLELQSCHDGAKDEDFVSDFKDKVKVSIKLGYLPELQL